MKSRTIQIDVLQDNRHEKRLVFKAFSLSMVCHLIFFSLLLYAQIHKPRRRPTPSIMNVSLVSMPAYSVPSKTVSKVSVDADKPAPKKAVTIQKKEAQTTSRKSKTFKKKTSLKKKTFKSEKVKQRALEKIEKQVETTTSDRIASAIERLKAKVDQESKGQPKETTATATETKPDFGGERQPGGKVGELIDIYRVEIAYQVQKNWAFPDQLAGGRSDLLTALVFKVMPNGEIKDLIVMDRSGNRHFDESAYRAVMKSNPVDPHPQGITQPYVQMGLRFTPEGIR
jgi:colicin import membrane protein